MRDGVRLDTNIFFPKAGNPPYPTILIRSPYAEHFIFDYYLAKDPAIRSFLESGYVIVYQHERGRYWSEGESVYLAQAKNDGFDTLSWLAKQPWSNGKIGTFGCSSLATNQLSLMTANHPSHKAAIVQGYGTGVGHIGPYWEQGFLRGGVAHLWGAI